MAKQPIIWCSLILCLSLLSCEKEDLPSGVIAVVGDTQITIDDFKRAYIPILLYSDKQETQATREEVLNFLINQSILAQEARAMELDTVQTLEVLKRTAEKTAFTRILYGEWVKSKLPTPTESDLRQAFQQSHTGLLVRHLFFEDQQEANRIHQELANGANWDSVAAITFDEASLAASGGVLGWIKFGDMDRDFEQAAYALQTGQRSSPVKTRFGWHIIQVDERSRQVMLTEYDFSLQRTQLKRIIRERHQQVLADSVVNALMAKANLTFHPDIAPRVWQVMQTQIRQLLDLDPLEETLDLELNSFEDQLDPILGEEMLRFSNSVWTVKTFLEKLPEMNRQLMLTDLKQATAFLVRDELIYQEGIHRDLHLSEEVLSEVRDRENQFLANLYLRFQADHQLVSPAAVEQFYREHALTRYQAADSLYVIQVALSDPVRLQEVKSAFDGGTNLGEIKSRVNQDKDLHFQELGWFRGARNDYPGYYHQLVNTPVNTLLGPIDHETGIALIMATERRRHATPLDDIYDVVRLDAQEDRNKKLRLRESQRLSAKVEITIDRSKLNDLHLSD